ncbi:hypothetical protein [Cellulomonas sp. KRMCY2]|uniref:5'-methylthioadenosine/S-adenosylhomocysteine nucleosidase family protein n=1 Tax=Cellulomonas sp. KRMCY2 TaxID=1304865 RepID=UPI00045E986A|nr:hypothetical protein [Cellulomonas sp. KRMCY2]
MGDESEDVCLNGASGKHVHVLVFTITDKEFPRAQEVFERFSPLAEVADTGAYAPASCVDTSHIPFALVQSDGLTTLVAAGSLAERIRQFRPQIVIVVGTAGGVHRPIEGEPGHFKGPDRGDVLVSEYVHHTNFIKSEPHRYLIRYLALDQPSMQLISDAKQVSRKTTWLEYLGPSWEGAGVRPAVHFGEIVSGDTLADDPLEPRQQTLMKHFDKAIGIEMESSGIAHSLHRVRTQTRLAVHYNPTFITVRGVSDIVYGRGQERELVQADIDATLERSGIGVGKTDERATWSPRAASSAAAFAAALTRRVVANASPLHRGHPMIPAYSMNLATDPEVQE